MPYRLEINNIEVREGQIDQSDPYKAVKRLNNGSVKKREANRCDYIYADIVMVAVGKDETFRSPSIVRIKDDGRPNKEAQVRSALQGSLISYANSRGANENNNSNKK